VVVRRERGGVDTVGHDAFEAPFAAQGKQAEESCPYTWTRMGRMNLADTLWDLQEGGNFLENLGHDRCG
jgi:hypothetical protein